MAASNQRPSWLSVLSSLLLLLTFGLRLYHLDWQAIWEDEGFTVYYASISFNELLNTLPVDHVPLYFLLMQPWTRMAGISEFSVRFPSLWFGVLLVPLGYALGRQIGGKHLGLLVGLLLTVSPPFVYQSQNARMYTMLAVLGSLYFFFLLRIREDWRPLLLWFGLTASLLLAVYTHYFSLILLLATAARLLPLCLKQLMSWKRYLISQFATLVLFVPWILFAAKGAYGNLVARAMRRDVMEVVANFWPEVWLASFFQPYYNPFLKAVPLWSLVVIPLLLVGMVQFWRLARPKCRMLVVYICTCLVAGYAAALTAHDFGGRYLFFMVPALYALLAQGLLAFRGRWWLVSAIGMAMVPSVWGVKLHEYFFAAVKEDLPQLTRQLRAYAEAGDPLVVNSSCRDVSLAYYLQDDYPQRILIPMEQPQTPTAVAEKLQPLMDPHARIWVVFFGTWKGNHTWAIEEVLSHAYTRVMDSWDGTTRLWLYARPSDDQDRWQQREISWAQGPKLNGLSWRSPGVLEAGEVMHLGLRWETSENELSDYAFSLRLTDSKGYLWQQQEGHLSPADDTTFSTAVEGQKELRSAFALLIPLETPRDDMI